MKLEELSQNEVAAVSGGRRNLGSLYQYTGDPADRDTKEYLRDIGYSIFDFIFRELY